MMPIEKTQLFFTLRIYEPKLELIEASNEISFFTHIDVIGPGGLKGSGRGQIIGAIRYEAETGEFFLDSPKLKRLEISRFPKVMMKTIAIIVEPLLARASARLPVYRLQDDNKAHQLAKSTLKSIKVRGRKLVISLSIF